LHSCQFLSAQGDGSSRAITGSDFFRRHPALHPALRAHLTTAVERLAAGDAGHPSLFPVLALLARLRCILDNFIDLTSNVACRLSPVLTNGRVSRASQTVLSTHGKPTTAKLLVRSVLSLKSVLTLA